MSDDNDDSSVGRGGLADHLEQLDIDAPERDDSSTQPDDPPPEQTDEPESAPAHPHAPSESGEAPELSDEELFERAIADMSPEDVKRAKKPSSERRDRASRTVEQTPESDALPSRDELPEQGDAQSAGADSQSEDEGRPPTERELFEEVVSDLGPEDMYRGKFEGRSRGLPEKPEPTPTDRSDVSESSDGGSGSATEVDEERAREALGELRTMRQFEKAVGPVDRDIDRDKYRQKSARRDPKKDVEKRLSYRSDAPDDLTTPPLPKSGDGLNNVVPLAPAHKDLLERFQKRARRDEVLEINVRGDTVEDALRQVELFVHQQWKERAGFCRLVHGRGLRSKGDPVLKPAILRWLEGPGFRYVRGYAPETNKAGDYGSVVVELADRREE